nr:hypothetical protein [Tanacetum cinerariifolium]
YPCEELSSNEIRGGRVDAIGTVPVCCRCTRKLGEGMGCLAGKSGKGYCLGGYKGNDDNAAEEPVTAVDNVKGQSIPSPTPPTPPPQQPQDIPSTSQAQSPLPQPLSLNLAQTQGADFPMSLLQEALDTYTALARQVEHLEHNKVAQNLEITMLKTRVKKLKRANKVKTLKLRRLRKVGTSQRVDTSDDTIMEELNKDEGAVLMNEKEETKEVKNITGDAHVEGRQAEIYQIDMDLAAKVLKVVAAVSETVNAAPVVPTVTTAVVPTITTAPVKKAAKRRRLNEEAEDVEELKQYLEIVPDEDDDVYTEATPLARKVPVADYQIIHFNNKPHYKIIRADGTHQLYVSFITLLKNFDREDLESLWSLVKERLSTSKPNNFSDDYLLSTLRAMFERPDGQDQVWMSQRSVHGQARVKSWKLLESCGVHIITFTTTQLILLVERRYPLSRFTLDQMLNTVRLQVEE